MHVDCATFKKCYKIALRNCRCPLDGGILIWNDTSNDIETLVSQGRLFKRIPSSETIWSASNTFLLPNKVKEIHFKILHRYYLCNFLTSLKKTSLHYVVFVILTLTLLHLFCSCKYSEDFWKQVSMMFFFDTFYKIIRIDEAMIIFLDCNSGSDIIDNTLKLIILLGKFHIHKAKVMSIKPSFNFVCKDF